MVDKYKRRVGAGFSERIERQRHVDVFWKKLHESCSCIPTEENVAQDLLQSVGIRSKRQLREATTMNTQKPDELYKEFSDMLGVSPIQSHINIVMRSDI